MATDYTGNATFLAVRHAQRRAAVARDALVSLRQIPGVGPALAADLYLLGYRQVADLVGADPDAMYGELMRLYGAHVDRCVLYAFRCGVYFATHPSPAPERLKWWNWKD